MGPGKIERNSIVNIVLIDAFLLLISMKILSYLTQEQGKLSEEVISLLKYAGLCDANGEKRFQFLLLDRSSQGFSHWFYQLK